MNLVGAGVLRPPKGLTPTVGYKTMYLSEFSLFKSFKSFKESALHKNSRKGCKIVKEGVCKVLLSLIAVTTIGSVFGLFPSGETAALSYYRCTLLRRALLLLLRSFSLSFQAI